MKKIFNILFFATALLAFAPFMYGQPYGEYSINGQITDPKTGKILEWPKDNGVHKETDFAYSKDISSPQSDGTYWIKLESFSTGHASYIEAAAPADIVLVLDVSSSMYENRGTTRDYYLDVAYNSNNVRNGTVFSYSSMNDTDYYYQVGDTRYPVRRERYPNSGNNRRYYLYYFEDADGDGVEDNGENRYYLNVDGTVQSQPNTRPAGVTQQGGQLFSGTLVHYRVQQRIDALRQAVKDFIAVIDHNDQYDDDDNIRVDDEGNPRRLGNRISIITFASADNITVVNSLDNGWLGNGAAEALEAKVDQMRLYSGTRQDEGINEANNQFSLYVDDLRKAAASRTVVLFTDGEPYANGVSTNTLYDNGVKAARVSKKTHEATVFTVGVFSNSPTPNVSALWFFMNYMSSNAPNAEGRTEPGENFNPDAGYYKDASDPNMDLSAVFTEIAHQSGGSSTTLSAASSNVDVVSNSFILPEGADADNIQDYVKIFVAKLEKMEVGGKYVFYEEYLKGHTPSEPVNDREGYYYYPLNEDGEIDGPLTKVDATINVSLEAGDAHKIKVTGFDYSSMYCGPVYNEGYTPSESGTTAEDLANVDHYQGYKIIIMIPIKMNPDAVGGPDVETNAPGSGIYVTDGDETAYVPYKSPTVSLPVNIHITKSGLKPGESAKFMIERADLPKEGPVDYSTLTWKYVSTVFVTRPQNAKDTDPDPVVYVRGLPANEDVSIGEGESATTEHRSFVYRISEENWSWSYTINTEPKYTDTDYIDNPFTFVNEPIQGIDQKVRHAESKATNVFKEGVVNVKYDDSKTNVKRTTPTE